MFVIIVAIMVRKYLIDKIKIGGQSEYRWFVPRDFVNKEWDVSTTPSNFTKITSNNWKNFRKQPELYFANKGDIMRFCNWQNLPPEKDTEYMIKYRVDEHALGDNAFLMAPYLREWQNKNVYTLIEPGTTIFDIGIGDGRSRDLWLSKNLTVYGCEPGDHINKLIKRRLPRVHVLQTGGEDPEIRKFAPRCDYVMMSYSITFFYKNANIFNQLIDNLVYLAPEILIVGMDGDVVDKWPDKIDNHLMKFEKKYRKRATFGNEIELSIKSPTTLVENQTEYLVDFSVLIKTLLNKGYKVKTDVSIPSPVYFGEASQFILAQRFLHFSKF